MVKQKPILSIVTINFNNALGLNDTLKSMQAQLGKVEWEHIIIDGGSTDSSYSIISNYQEEAQVSIKLVSEKDSGIYDAMNKGLRLASGDYVAYLNSGDVLSSQNILSMLTAELLSHEDLDLAYGDIVFMGKDNLVTRCWKAGELRRYKMFLGWHLPHPMTTMKLQRLIELGGFDMKYKIAADYHLILKYVWNSGLKYKYLNLPLVKMEPGGVSNSSLRNMIKANYEVLMAWRDVNTIIYPFWLFVTKPLLKIFQIKFRKLRENQIK